MTRKEIERQCMAVCPSMANSECAFVPDGAVGFIDTSARSDGSRGIAFFNDKAAVNFDGYAREIPYKDIRSVQILESFENSFADELIITGHDFDIRISDYSLDKPELKLLIDSLCSEGFTPDEDEPELGEENPESSREEITEDFLTENAETIFDDIPENQPDLNDSSEDNPVIEDDMNAREEAPENREITGDILTENAETVSDDISENQPEINNSSEDNSTFENPVIEDDTDAREETPENREIAGDILTKNAETISGDIFENQPDLNDSGEENPVIEDDTDAREESPETREITGDIITKNAETIFNDISENQPDLNDSAEENPVIPEFDDDDAEITPIKVLPKIFEKTPEESFSFEVVENSVNSENDDDDFDEQAELERISAMSHEQTMSYLAEAFSEINGTNSEEQPDNANTEENAVDFSEDTLTSEITDNQAVEKTPERSRVEERTDAPVLKKGESGLTTEPIWGDIYIKASRSLRELCEDGKLSMDMIRAELRERLLPSAEAFAKITNDESKIPKVLMPKITELRSAANNFDEYFSYGDDIGTRAMFFMLYQMLSYADRIVENPEAKARLNDFFRRFGSAGIILSMLDMRV